jgi:hypothetical protein
LIDVLVRRWLVLASLTLAGCSLALSGPDPNRPHNKAPQCDTGKGLVALDYVLAAGMGVTAIALGSSNNSGGAVVVPVLAGVAFVAAAVHGNSVVDSCRKEMNEYAAESDAPPEPPPRIPPPRVPAVAASTPPPAPPPPPRPRPQPEPEQQQQQQPQQQPAHEPPPPAKDKDDPWASFWKETP